MKTKTIAVIAALGLLPIAGFAQAPPPPPPPNQPGQPGQPVPPIPPVPPRDHDRGPKVPVTYLGVETSSVPRVVSEQLGLAKGFGLVVDYVVPDGPAAAGGVQQNDILKMLNDQILMEPEQLAKLIRSFPEGTSVTLTILRKGAESKLTVKLAKKEIPSGHDFFGPGFEKHWSSGHEKDFGQMNLDMEKMRGQLSNLGPSIRDTVRDARREALRASSEARRAAREMRVMSKDKGAMKSTTIDLRKAQIVLSDAQGEMKIENVDGKKSLTAKDPQGKLLFSGPIETKEDLDKLPPDVRQRYDKLEQKELPAAVPTVSVTTSSDGDDDVEMDVINDSDMDNDKDSETDDASMQQVSFRAFPNSYWVNTVLI